MLIAGPCAVEDERQLLSTAIGVAAAGAQLLRGGAFKPRAAHLSRCAFQGLPGAAGLELLARARRETGLLVVTEAMDQDTLDQVAEVADVIQVGSRNMVNYALLRRVARTGKPVLLKRGMAATLDELLFAAEYILAEGNPQVILCERGVRGFDRRLRGTCSTSPRSSCCTSARTSPSSPTRATAPGAASWCRRWRVRPSRPARHGVMVEVHPDPRSRQVRWSSERPAGRVPRDGSRAGPRGGRRGPSLSAEFLDVAESKAQSAKSKEQTCPFRRAAYGSRPAWDWRWPVSGQPRFKHRTPRTSPSRPGGPFAGSLRSARHSNRSSKTG